MADKQIVPYNYNQKAMIPLKRDPAKALVPPAKYFPGPKPHKPFALPPPQGSMYAQPVRERIEVPDWMEVDKPKQGETLTGVKRDIFGNTKEHTYTTPRFTITGIRARPDQIKKIPAAEAVQRMTPPPSPPKKRKTVAELMTEVDFLKNMCDNMHKVHSTLTRTVVTLCEKEKRKREDKEERKAKKAKNN